MFFGCLCALWAGTSQQVNEKDNVRLCYAFQGLVASKQEAGKAGSFPLPHTSSVAGLSNSEQFSIFNEAQSLTHSLT